ncbi:MAG: tyrosine-type recombinase/integrase [Acidobacteria bacterium]|nr:tyrosine-type recombinase/integrase [Acidobacteriota bacterium]
MDTVSNLAPVRPEAKPTGRHPSNALSAAFLRSAPPGRHADGNGLYLFVLPSGTRSWIQRLVVRGRRRELGLGSVARVPLAEAGEKALANRKLAREGGDPLAEKRRAQGIPTFSEAASRVLEQKRDGWRGRRHHREWMASLRRYAFPRIGKMPVSEVTSADLLEILTPIWHRKASSARRVRQRISAVMKWAIAQGYRMANPAGEALGAALPRQGSIPRHFKALPYGEVAGAVRTVRHSEAAVAVKLGFEFLVLTACRSGEMRGARWEEIDLEAATWTVPPERMKHRREHRVPLSARAREILAEAGRTESSSDLVFPSLAGGLLPDRELSSLLRELGIGAVPHGFRSSFRDWAAEETDAPHAMMEAALSHVIRNQVEAAYARSDLFERRRVLMEAQAKGFQRLGQDGFEVGTFAEV